MIWWILLGFAVTETIQGLSRKYLGYHVELKFFPLAYENCHIIDWHWEFGDTVKNEFDDKTDFRHIPRVMQHSAFGVEPLWFRFTVKKTIVLRDGSGREYGSAEERLRVHEHQRMRHGKVLPDYTPDDYRALVGLWTPELHQQKKEERKTKREQLKARANSQELADDSSSENQ